MCEIASDSLTTPPDYTVTRYGSLCLLTPLSGACSAILADILGDGCTWYAGALVVEPRYLDALLDALDNEGMEHA